MPTMQEMCETIARGFEARGVTIRNLTTGRTIPNAQGEYCWQDVWEWDSHGELWYLWEWYALVGGVIAPAETPDA